MDLNADETSRNILKVRAGKIAFQANPLRLLVLTVLLSLTAEILGILFVEFFPPKNHLTVFLLDAAVPSLFLIPILYYFLFRPIKAYQDSLLKIYQALQQSKDELEDRVKERTDDLTHTNENLVAEVSNRLKAEANIERKNRELQLLFQNSASLAQSLVFCDRISTIQKFLTQEVGACRGSIYFRSTEDEGMVERATWGDILEDFDLKAQHQLILQNHEPLFLNLPPRRSSSAPKGTPLVYAGIPLIAKDQIFGVLDIFLEDTEYISGDHKSFLFALANQVASALSNALLFESEIAARKTSARLFNQAKGDRERLRVLTKKLVEAQEKERREIARELHDQTSQALVYLKIVLGLLRVEASDPQKVSERVAELNQITEDILNDLHRLAADLRPGTLDLFGLVPALQQYISNLSNKPGPKVNFTCLNVDQRFPPEVEVHLFRLVQEAVTNIFRHAHATNADILLSAAQDKITLRVADDGIGFIFDEAIQKERLGLIGMRERVEMLGGTFQVDSTPDSGTQILIEVPYAH